MTAMDDEMEDARAAMVREIERTMADLAPRSGRLALSSRVLDVMRETPRHLFVSPGHLQEAYLNRPVQIGYRQTISQPLIVALMTDLLDLAPEDKVLEVGTGSGYQTAVLARLARSVYTIELCAPLAERAARVLADLGIGNVETRIGDGHLGWPEEAPFDAILVAAAPPEVPEALVRQLKPGGRLVLPVGILNQQLIVVEKRSDQSTVLREIIPVCFVPLTRHGTPSEL
ncbi:MAG TPA: protein-L-isoaspartate(D-aspartate) O-methyltransferase [Hyphomicrobium sp.]|nr:protein-L-isoaspartate(D-aspartate) O-methyltransferase [Hyphomicrobium sp.]